MINLTMQPVETNKSVTVPDRTKGNSVMNKKLQDALNKQLNEELYASYLYLSMSAWCQSQGLNGIAHWMQLQSQEEYGHAMRIFNYINDRNGKVILAEIKAPAVDWDSVKNVIKDTCKHEAKVTAAINELMNLAISEKDHASVGFLNWFVTEQVEEEATAGDILDKLELAGNSPGALFMIDRLLGSRPAAPAENE